MQGWLFPGVEERLQRQHEGVKWALMPSADLNLFCRLWLLVGILEPGFRDQAQVRLAIPRRGLTMAPNDIRKHNGLTLHHWSTGIIIGELTEITEL
jgi:hypothetical protein